MRALESEPSIPIASIFKRPRLQPEGSTEMAESRP